MSVGTTNSVDVAVSHPFAFVFMLILMLIFALVTIARQTKISVKITSFLNLWMAAYLMLLSALMSVTTSMALVLLFDNSNHLRVAFLPASFGPMAAAVFGVFGFELLFRKFIVGFGEAKFDLSTTLQDLVDQVVAATLKRETS